MRLIALFALLVNSVLAAPPRPNIVLFIADNWRFPHASILGDATVQTPTFDRIAKEGMLLTHTFCPVPSCSPTRSCILTGRASHQLEGAASLWSAFSRKLAVFTDALREAGYEVGYSGKGWSPGNHVDSGWPENPAGAKFKDLAEFLAKRDASKPFFFWSGNTDTSLNKWKPAAADLSAASVRVPPELPDVPEVRAEMLSYYDGVRRIDADAAACIAALEQSSQSDRTLFLYTSDNGWQMPRGLANCYDSGTRVPFAARWPGKIKPGTRSDAMLSLTDLAPTILATTGLPVPAIMTGRSFLPLLLGEDDGIARDHLFIERERHANVRAGDQSYPIRGIRTRNHLYLWNLRPERWPGGDPKVHFAVGDYGDVDPSKTKAFMLANPDHPAVKPLFDLSFGNRPAEELYDLRTDPAQLKNVADEAAQADTKAKLRARVEQWMRDTQDPRVDPSFDGFDKYPYFGGKAKQLK